MKPDLCLPFFVACATSHKGEWWREKKVSFTDVFSLFLQGHNADTCGALFKECARVSGGVYVGKEMKCK